jgi:hypothetical protein
MNPKYNVITRLQLFIIMLRNTKIYVCTMGVYCRSHSCNSFDRVLRDC